MNEEAGRLMMLLLALLLAAADSLAAVDEAGEVAKTGMLDSTIGSAVGAAEADREDDDELDVGAALTLEGLVLMLALLDDEAAGAGA